MDNGAGIGGIEVLPAARNGAEWEAQVRALLAHPEVGPGCFTVAADGDRVVGVVIVLAVGALPPRPRGGACRSARVRRHLYQP